MKVYTLKPLSPFHLQTGGLDHEKVDQFPRSDTLSAALMHLWARQNGSIPGLPAEPPFQVSSMYPCLLPEHKSGMAVKLFPKPKSIDYDSVGKGNADFNHKDFKGIQWMSEGLFLNSLKDAALLQKSFAKENIAFSGKVWLDADTIGVAKDYESALYKEHDRTRVVLDRETNAATPFHFITVEFQKAVGLFFIASVKSEYEKEFLFVLNLLGDEGLGADRTVGMGRFEVVAMADWKPGINSNKASRWLNLGMFNPTEETRQTINWSDSSYDLVNRGGWVSKSPLRRQSVRMIPDGAVFKSDSKPKGRLVNVLDPLSPALTENQRKFLELFGLDHPVYRDGRAFFIPIGS